MKKRFLALFLCVIMVIGISPVNFDVSVFADRVFSGGCGNNINFRLDLDSKILTITGDGKMPDYTYNYFPEIQRYSTTAPWGYYVSSIEKVIIEEGVTSVGAYAFYWCNNLSSVIIGDDVTLIEHNAFQKCSKLSNVTFGKKITEINSNSFDSCSKLDNILLPDGVTYISENAFINTGLVNNADNWVDNVLYIGNILYSVKGNLKENYTIKYGTTTIVSNAFKNHLELTGISIPNTVKSIGNAAFASTGIKSISLPNTVTEIGVATFSSCEGLESISIPNSVTHIGGSAFAHCYALKNINIPQNVKYIDSEAFEYCSSLTSLVIPDNTLLNSRTFAYCSGLKYLTIGKGVGWIDYTTFMGCSSLESIVVSSENTDYSSPSNCLVDKNTKTLILGCKNSIIPDDGSVTSIGYYAFENCVGLKNITIPNSVTTINEYSFKGCTGLTDIVIPNGITSINKGTFTDCSSLTNITIPNNILNIDQGVFSGCVGLKSIIIPNSVTNIGSFAFSGCSGLEDIYYYGTLEEWKACNGYRVLSNSSLPNNSIVHWYVNVGATVTCLESGFSAYSYWENTNPIEYIVEPISMNALGHDIIHNEGKPSTCKEKGYADYDTCSRCDYTTYSELPLADHTPAAVVTENEVKATCTEDGSYDSVVYCSVCGEELNRDTVNVPMTDHSPTTIIKENIIAATCTENGSYDKVIYCSVCGDELSRKTETTAKTGHKDKNNDGVCDICGTVTDTAKHNAYLLGKAKINVKSSATVDYRSTVTVTATASGLPEGYVLAVYEGSTLKAKGSATSVSYNAGELMGNKTFTVKVVNSGNTPQKDSSGKEVSKTVEVKVKSGFFDKLIAFFRNLFGSLPKVEIKP